MASKLGTSPERLKRQRGTNHYRKLFNIAIFAAWTSVIFSINKLLWIDTSNILDINRSIKLTIDFTRKGGQTFTLSPGELPGYTGWARPEYTLAGHFEIQNRPASTSLIGEEWFVDLTCTIPECQNGGSLFYVRAYGPAVITGRVVDRLDGTYRVVLRPVDVGQYFVEVVLSFSHSPPWEDFPLENETAEPGYEGYLLPGFPLFLSVLDSSIDATNKHIGRRRWCDFDDLVVKNSSSGLLDWRWKVVDSVRNKAHYTMTPNIHEVTFAGYQHGFNSLGIKMQYISTKCEIWEARDVFSTKIQGLHVFDQCVSDINNTNTDMHFIFIGDSVMDLQVDVFELMMGRLQTENVFLTKIDTRGGIIPNVENITRTLKEIQATRPNEKRFLLFNSGLHDVDRLCCSQSAGYRQTQFNNSIYASMPCVDTYRKMLAELVQIVGEFQAELKVFRSSTAAWLKYGNFGFGWPPNQTQLLARSPNFVSHFNDIAFDVIAKSGQKIYISDGYWISLPRPDNTEAGRLQARGKHLVHPGMDVVIALTMNWLLLVMRHLCSSTVEAWGVDIFSAQNVE